MLLAARNLQPRAQIFSLGAWNLVPEAWNSPLEVVSVSVVPTLGSTRTWGHDDESSKRSPSNEQALARH